MDNLNKSIRTLEDEYSKNNDLIKKLNKKLYILELNSNETKLMVAIMFYLIGIAVEFFLLKLMIKTISLNILPLFMISPVIVGVISEKIYEQKTKMKQRLSQFTNAKTTSQKIYESTKYKIEYNKLLAKNKIIKKVYEKLINEKTIINNLNKNYEITKKNNNYNLEDTNVKIKDLEEQLNKNGEKLDNLLTNITIKNIFFNHEDKFSILTQLTVIPIISLVAGMISFNFPILYFNETLNILPKTLAFHALATGTISALLSIRYIIKNTIEHKKAKKILKEELNLKKESKNIEQLEKEVEKLIEETYIIRLNLEQVKRQKEEIIKEIKKHPKHTYITNKTNNNTKYLANPNQNNKKNIKLSIKKLIKLQKK